uniref:Bm10185 n=1 Tax=Brugia malayi TaxID=6279 RepID=A0A1I9G300_BRUMA|nr:Bm10185 [Brugia malayi]
MLLLLLLLLLFGGGGSGAGDNGVVVVISVGSATAITAVALLGYEKNFMVKDKTMKSSEILEMNGRDRPAMAKVTMNDNVDNDDDDDDDSD